MDMICGLYKLTVNDATITELDRLDSWERFTVDCTNLRFHSAVSVKFELCTTKSPKTCSTVKLLKRIYAL